MHHANAKKILLHESNRSPPIAHNIVGVLASGKGSNLRALINAEKRGELPGRIEVVFSNNPKSGALEVAREAGIAFGSKDHKTCASPQELDEAALEVLRPHKPDWICLAGYLRRVTNVLLEPYQGRIINIHPSLLPAFGGKGFYGKKVHQAVLDSGTKNTGVTIHIVDSEYDRGPIILQESVPVSPEDTVDSLAAKVLEVEHSLYPRGLKLCLEGRVKIENKSVRIL